MLNHTCFKMQEKMFENDRNRTKKRDKIGNKE